MKNRNFSDSTKLEVIKANLEKNNGEIHCESCGKKLVSINECHFDHIEPYAKGGKSILSNCQILCIECNLKKNDKQLRDFILEEKAKKFFAGEAFSKPDHEIENEDVTVASAKISKEEFDKAVGAFIQRKGDIHKVDFGRDYNHLPSIHYVRQYYGDLNNLKKAFGIIDLSYSWNRETIQIALEDFISKNGYLYQKDLVKSNGLPSLPCVLSYYPEFKNFSDIKRNLCRLHVPDNWTVENAILAGKRFVKLNGRINQKDLHAVNGLPTSKVISRLFGTLANYQEKVGSIVSQRNTLISKEDITKAVDEFFFEKERVVESKQAFFETFIYSPSTIFKRYGSFSSFCKDQRIVVLRTKKTKYTKREVDNAISNWVKNGNSIPPMKDLTKVGLPSQSVILKYYEDWKEPFYLYEKIHEEIERNKN